VAQILANLRKELTNMQANYWWGQMDCGTPNQNFGWALAHPAYHVAPHGFWETL